MNAGRHLDCLLSEWPYTPDELAVRLVKGKDGRDLIQLRIDLGILQLETSGRPDGERPEGYLSMLDLLRDHETRDPGFELDEEQCFEVDREFMQFYHRRMAWLQLQRYANAVRDADHTLALMDICRDHSPCEEWTLQHEQHRPMVLFHRSEAAALDALERGAPVEAIEALDAGLSAICDAYVDLGWEADVDSDELVQRLSFLRDKIRSEYRIGKSLQEQLDEAVQREQYELAAKLRDEMARREKAE